jgi:hypothetical protein
MIIFPAIWYGYLSYDETEFKKLGNKSASNEKKQPKNLKK